MHHHDTTTLLDGPTGTELQRRGLPTTLPLWTAGANRTAPEMVVAIHRDYIEAGAEVITANTFRTNARAVVNSGLSRAEARELTRMAVRLARHAIELSNAPHVLVAGSDAPAEDCYSPEQVPDDRALRDEHREHIEWMMEEGCDLILIETMNTLREAVIATEAARTLGARTWTSIVTDSSGERLLSGESVEVAVDALAALAPEAILVNCAGPTATLRAVELLADRHRERGAGWRFGGYANSGEPDLLEGWNRVHTVPTDKFVELAGRMIALGATVIGSCCGTTPETTRALRNLKGPRSMV